MSENDPTVAFLRISNLVSMKNVRISGHFRTSTSQESTRYGSGSKFSSFSSRTILEGVIIHFQNIQDHCQRFARTGAAIKRVRALPDISPQSARNPRSRTPNDLLSRPLEHGRLHNSPAEVITWNGVPLPIVDEYKYLGLIIDKKFKFKKHATKKLSACASRLGMISAFCRNPKIPYKMKKQLISATALSGIAYGIQFYGWEQQKILKDAISKAARQLTT